MRNILFGIVLITLGTACVNDELCVGTSTGLIKLSFVESGSSPESAISITFDSIGVSGMPENYPSYADTTLSKVGLIVDPDSTLTRFVFITQNRTDTLDITYTVVPSLISINCGPELIYSRLDTVSFTFDSLVIESDIFDLEVDTNLKIYY